MRGSARARDGASRRSGRIRVASIWKSRTTRARTSSTTTSRMTASSRTRRRVVSPTTVGRNARTGRRTTARPKAGRWPTSRRVCRTPARRPPAATKRSAAASSATTRWSASRPPSGSAPRRAARRSTAATRTRAPRAVRASCAAACPTTRAAAARARVAAAPDRAAARARPRPRTRWSASSSRPTTAWRSTARRWTPARAIRTHVPPRPDALTRARGAGDVPGMTRHVLVALVCALPALARADLSAEVKTHEETFARACAAGDIPAVLALYADDARLVWPDAGEEGRGKADIERLATAFCKHTKDLQLTLASLDAVPIDDTHVATVAHWEMSATAPDGKKLSAKVRSTEVLVKTGGAWRYLVDHASLGRPPAPTATRRTRRRR
ncbi:MAG: DUF4440 domain-containing protein [Deltaproteobacteria bacterium]|nr:MAG: DUF4440 domain-containing protein [Deltaproteobacteria bacterium]